MKIVNNIEAKILEELEKRCFLNNAYTFKQIEDMVADKEKYQVLGVVDNEILKGYLIIFDNSESLEIMKIGTLPEYRKQGVAKLLIEELLKLKKDIFLEVRESNSAREFYKNCGFQEIGKRKNYYPDTGEAAIIMMRNI
ncbi:ribosomal protein S18-alanine N-acetyltransferase [Fusobacterium mortiferum]|uniref:ribosomal protein S18-alanine N-acetyltransferase n=1 Tax=Fusobacterium mortiferum TaxID=850 RepID=UPI001956B83D|nr:ribosomal protein S18-alanine N-acetyltransferase [Fusobacterium mortiferum]